MPYNVYINQKKERNCLMSRSFIELKLKEYPYIVRTSSPNKEIQYRFRILKRILHGIPRIFFDMRQFLIKEQYAHFLESGMYFDEDQTKQLISYLQDSLKVFKKEREKHGTQSRARAQNTFGNKK